MPQPAPDSDSLQAEYVAAVAEERAWWTKLHDPILGPVERLLAYASWRAAAARNKDVAAQLRELIATPAPTGPPS